MTRLHIVLSELTVTHASITKISCLQKKLAAELVWYLHSYQGFFERHYINDDLADVSHSLQINIDKQIKQVESKIKQHFPTSTVYLCQDKYWSEMVDSKAKNTESRVIIKAKTGLSGADQHYLNHYQGTVFIFNQTPWLSQGQAIGAIDPFHEDDPENKAAYSVVKFMRLWCASSKHIEATLLHAIHIPPLAIEYEKQIEALHVEQVYRFASQIKYPKALLAFIRGIPEQALIQYVTAHKIDVMVLGARKHSIIAKWLNGSTISALLSHNSVDMVLINTA
ncbi:Universal stress protein family protein [Colwellia chukchiensis]|uniref:Universal stress protein family protein n=1 Tax=Colwellia chukchiensis TaxID=641665 RepID=A0A1H7NWB0_9GAMM|nr:universal stress protein [Colwellia chukchiensis]SEL27167.1 Universal stress protein family protein [Colwellia chukchiensis]